MITRSLTILALVCALGTHAFAQTPPPPPGPGGGAGGPGPWTTPAESTLRQGLMFGFGLGPGSLSVDCDDCDAVRAGGVSGHIGYMLTPNLAILADFWVMVHNEDFLTVYQNINTLAARYWVTPALWVQGGLGNANVGYKWDGIFVNIEDETKSAPGVMFGVGYEFYVKPKFAIDVSLRYGTGFYDDEANLDYEVKAHSAQLNFGFSWY